MYKVMECDSCFEELPRAALWNIPQNGSFVCAGCYSDIMEPYSEIQPPKKTIPSNGGATEYYMIPEHADELRHLISHKAMSKSRGDIFKACYRLGEKEGIDTLYDLNKMKFFIEDLIEMYHRDEHL